MNTDVDLLIQTCIARDVEVWKHSSRAVIQNISAREYVVIVPEHDISLFKGVAPLGFRVESESEYSRAFVQELGVRLADASNMDRFGWYLQQFIKLEAVRRLQPEQKAVIWDADTIPLSPIRFFTPTGQPEFFFGTEYHIPYFGAIHRCLGLDKQVEESFIAQCFPTQGTWATEMFAALEESGHEWFETLMNSIDFREASGFSEYETLGTFFAARNAGEMRWQGSPWIRDGYSFFAGPEQLGSGSRRVAAFVSFESWAQKPRDHKNQRQPLDWPLRVFRYLRSRLARGLREILPSKSFRRWRDPNLTEFLEAVFAREAEFRIVQGGACDGVSHDPLRPFLQKPGRFVADLFEPVPEYGNRAAVLYEGRADVRVHLGALGKSAGSTVIHYLPPDIAAEMDGDGPQNLWAYGQGSSMREVVVYWIFRNAFRGVRYKQNIQRYIGSIRQIEAQVLAIAEVLRDDHRGNDCLLLLDVQGSEYDILRGLDESTLPKWIVIETDRGTAQEKNYLEGLGYLQEVDGTDSCFSLPGYEVLLNGAVT
jgi:hypothetical protein